MNTTNSVNRYWRCYGLLLIGVLVVGCQSIDQSVGGNVPPCEENSEEQFWRCWKVLNANLSHEEGHSGLGGPHIKQNDEIQFFKKINSSGDMEGLVAYRNGRYGDEWEKVLIKKPTPEQLAYLRFFFTPTAKEFCDSDECMLGTLRTAGDHHPRLSNQLHMVFFDVVETRTTRPECEGKDHCLQMVVFCYNECTEPLPPNVQIPVLGSSSNILWPLHRGIAHSGDED